MTVVEGAEFSSEWREWIKPIMFSAGLGLLKSKDVEKKSLKLSGGMSCVTYDFNDRFDYLSLLEYNNNSVNIYMNRFKNCENRWPCL